MKEFILLVASSVAATFAIRYWDRAQVNSAIAEQIDGTLEEQAQTYLQHDSPEPPNVQV